MSLKNILKYDENTSTGTHTSTQDDARCAINEDGYIVYSNEAFCELTGTIPNSGNHISEIIQFSDDLDECIENTGDLSVIPTGVHDVHIKDNGILTEFHFDWLTTPNNENYLIASAIRENHEDKLDLLMTQIQDSLSRIETTSNANDFRSHLESTYGIEDINTFIGMSSDMMVITDTDGRIISANDSFIALADLRNPRKLNGISIYSFLGTDEQTLLSQKIKEIQSGGDTEFIDSYESQFYSSNGHVHHIEWRQKYQHGKIYISGRDITDIKEKRQHLQRRERQLSEAEAIGRMGHWHWPIGNEDITWSEEIYRIFGVNRESYKPRINTLGDLVYRRDLGRVIQIFQRAIIEEKNYNMEFRINRPDGDVRFILCEGRCEKNSEGEVVALYGIMQDMTERVLYEQELHRAKDASEQAYAAKSRFLANMSHELRTPLNAIIGFSEMIETQMLGPIFNTKYIDYATSIRESGNHLLHLISDILDMSKIEAGKHVLDLEEIKIKKIIDRSFEMVRGRASEQNINLRTPVLLNEDLTIICDRRAIMQIFLNLLSNAVKFTKSNGSVWLECHEYEKYACFKICDTGIGIPPNKLASVLRPFEQASNEYTRDYEGTGLGLSITKELVEMHGGAISIESSVGIGTTVTVKLPYKAAYKAQ